MKVEDLDLEKLEEEDRAVLFWKLAGTKVRRWTETQALMSLLGELSCPEGHTREISWFWADGQTAWFMKEGKKVPVRERFDSEGFDISEGGYWCCHCYDCGWPQAFFVPKEILESFSKIEG